jgi:hypothetical protein
MEMEEDEKDPTERALNTGPARRNVQIRASRRNLPYI